MTKANYLQRGEALDYTNATTEVIPAGVIVAIGNRIGVTGTEINPGETGSLHVVGCFEIAKTTASATFEQGADCFFDGTGIVAAAPSGDGAITTAIGYAAAPSAATDTTVLVKLNG